MNGAKSPFTFRPFIKYCTSGAFIALALLSSCVTQRNVEYMRDKDEAASFREPENPEYRIKPNDELYIKFSSMDETSANLFYSSMQQSAYISSVQPYGAYLLSYTVDKDGNLLVPLVGKVDVKDKTLPELSALLAESLSHILSQPIVSVKLVNRYVSVLGEVRSPGHYPYSQEKMTVYDALGLAGDMTDYGNRKDVVLVRNDNGQNKKIKLDLTRTDILASGYYFIRPNDVLYVKPLRKKFWGMREFPFAVILSAVTTGLLIYNVVKP